MLNRRKINILDESIAKKIAAGEIVERPSSVVKELVENAIDAQANNITIEIKNGGKEYISISDNGTGIASEDTKLAFIRHATSKISSLDDLYNINQMGFRGEALYSISAVSKVTLITKATDETIGSLTLVEGGEIVKNHEYGCPDGTTIIVEDLFYNTPARKKFMKNSSVETSNISSVIQKYILSYPNISFKFINNGKVIYFTNGDGSLRNAVFSVYGSIAAKNIVEFKTEIRNGISFNGCLGNKNLLNKTRNSQIVFINNRYIKDKNIALSVEKMYSANLMKHSYPFFIINVNINPLLVDVNVHPQKLNVVLSNPDQLLDEVKMQLQPYFKIINEQVIEFEAEKPIHKLKFPEKPIDSLNQKNNEIIEELNKNIEKEHIEIKEDFYDDAADNQVNFQYELSSFNYKSALVLDSEKKDTNQLKQKNTAVNLQYQQSEFKDLLNTYTIIGTAFNSFLFIECGDNVYIFDQHAAHERLKYENYIEIFNNKSPIMQKLLIPQTIELPYDDILIVEDNIKAFENVGYSLAVRDLNVDILGVPIFLGQPQMGSFFKEILANIYKLDKDEGSATDKIISMSCKKAVKAGDRLTDKEIKKLIDLIITNDIKLTCPHGRPFVTVITKSQIEKRFGRIL